MNNYEFGEEMKGRTKTFAVRIIKFYKRLPKTDEARVLGRQVLRSGTSVAANYRAICRARSKAEFVAKIGTVVEEADETVSGWNFWLKPAQYLKSGCKTCLQKQMNYWRSL